MGWKASERRRAIRDPRQSRQATYLLDRFESENRLAAGENPAHGQLVVMGAVPCDTTDRYDRAEGCSPSISRPWSRPTDGRSGFNPRTVHAEDNDG